MNGPEVLVPLAAIFFMFGLPVSGWIIVRSLAHKERMEMIRHGLDPGGNAAWREWRNQMAQAPGPAVGPPTWRPERGCDPSAQALLRRGMTIASVGLALTIGLSFIGYDHGDITPGPWLLGGLIPLFIGLAQVLTAVMSGAIVRAVPQIPPPHNVPPGPPPFAERTPTSTYEGSYTYRPGAAQELRPPAPPPASQDR